ncbi:class I SAM-dependent methyltransferase [Actinoplanes utahensis]|uniref:Protein-L-isoaspartate O-methyltransferase n=1 Tax=Actinoplanes utahensis TaxID=1869 RepID=A0A0A6UDQ0_ACTUT|nr:class I SAM-dependent methyltransferase [Actinoplanes utahensis]KHD73198.1 protein-L-isoaspartate O-methyltransferase [Actinoplanes utahensis]GIF34863.1 hypothetical protein Aut01nite_78490 [Actinoplanes utahensis]
MSTISRIHRRLPRLSGPQTAVMSVAGVLCAAAAATALTGHTGIAVALLAVLGCISLATSMLLFRRLARAQRAGVIAQRDLRTTVEEMQRRLVAAVERERLTAGDRHLELAEAIAALRQLTGGQASAARLAALPAEFEATVQLFQGFTPRAPMPPPGEHTLDPAGLLDLLHLIRLRKPRLVLELGSGVSSVWIAYALEKTGGRLITLDHDAGFARRTRALLSAHGLDKTAEVRDAPLTPVGIDGHDHPWYDPEALADLHDIDFVLIDGPPAPDGEDTRHPALHMIENRLADRATVVATGPDVPASWSHLTPENEPGSRHAVLSFTRTTAMVPVQA